MADKKKDQSVLFQEINKKQKEEKDKEEVGFFESALAGVATGLWNIPKGFCITRCRNI